MFFVDRLEKPNRRLGYTYDQLYPLYQNNKLVAKTVMRYQVVGWYHLQDGCYGKRCKFWQSCDLYKRASRAAHSEYSGPDLSKRARVLTKHFKEVVCHKTLENLKVIKKALKLYVSKREYLFGA